MIAATGMPTDHFCLACYSGDYPLHPPANIGKFCFESADVLTARPVFPAGLSTRQVSSYFWIRSSITL